MVSGPTSLSLTLSAGRTADIQMYLIFRINASSKLLHLWQTAAIEGGAIEEAAIEEAGEATSQYTTPQQYSYYIGWYVVSSVSHHWQSNATQLISGAARAATPTKCIGGTFGGSA